MADDEIVFDGKNFVDNLSNLLRAQISTGSVGPVPPIGFYASFATDSKPLSGWDGFKLAYNIAAGTPGSAVIENAFFNDYKAKIQNYGGLGLGPDWTALTDAVQGPGLGVTEADLRQQFKNAFSHFALTYPYVTVSGVGKLGPSGGEETTFFTNWGRYLARTAGIDDSTEGPLSYPSEVDALSYEQVWYSFFPGPTATEFAASLKEFYDDILKETGGGSPATGWFIPSQVFHKWYDKVRQDYLHQGSASSVELRTTVSTGTARRTLVLDRILRLLIEVIDVLQRVSAAQAQRLNFLTAWQSAYTEMLVNVPQYAQGDGSPLSHQNDDSKLFRNEVVNPHMQSILENVRAKRSAVQDEAKQLQTSINSSQDAANQQTQMATALLQQISGILSQIYR